MDLVYIGSGRLKTLEVTSIGAPYNKNIVIGKLRPFDFTKDCEEISKKEFTRQVMAVLGDITSEVVSATGVDLKGKDGV
ncbi:MAG: hypothetical protein DRN81_07295 [Thermoproteota archaeon]|nr:MAG: hypothetical protein DRN81_07295 [Candidatus Korarchaeota archaeon]